MEHSCGTLLSDSCATLLLKSSKVTATSPTLPLCFAQAFRHQVSETSISHKTSSKSHTSSLQDERFPREQLTRQVSQTSFVRDFLHITIKSPRPAFHVKSSKNHASSLQNEHFDMRLPPNVPREVCNRSISQDVFKNSQFKSAKRTPARFPPTHVSSLLHETSMTVAKVQRLHLPANSTDTPQNDNVLVIPTASCAPHWFSPNCLTRRQGHCLFRLRETFQQTLTPQDTDSSDRPPSQRLHGGKTGIRKNMNHESHPVLMVPLLKEKSPIMKFPVPVPSSLSKFPVQSLSPVLCSKFPVPRISQY